jgi:GT2 family glycosyltransferase
MNQAIVLPPATLKLSVVILTGGRDWRMVEDCIQTTIKACEKTKNSCEVIAIANMTGIGFLGKLQTAFPDITIIEFSPKGGFCTTNNAGFRASRGEYVLQLNDDTIVEPNALRRLLAFMDANPKVGACVPKLLNPDGSVQLGYTNSFPKLIDHVFMLLGVTTIFPNNPVNRRYLRSDSNHDLTQEVEQPAGAALMYRREVLEQVGLLDEDYTFLFDDVDVCLKIHGLGWKLYSVADASVIHYGGLTIGANPSREKLDNWYNGMMRFYDKRRPGKATVFKLIFLVACLLRGFVSQLQALLGNRSRREYWAGAASVYWKYFRLAVQYLFRPLPPRDRSSDPEPRIVQRGRELLVKESAL